MKGELLLYFFQILLLNVTGKDLECIDFYFHYETKFCRCICLTGAVYNRKMSSDKKTEIVKPILEVISSGKVKDSSKQSEVILDNIKERSLEKPQIQTSIISSESIKKLKDRITGITDKEGEGKGKCWKVTVHLPDLDCVIMSSYF